MLVERIPEKHRHKARNALLAAACCGPLGPVTAAGDVAAIAGVWGKCLYNVAKDEGRKMDANTAIGICKSVLLGAAGYYVGCKTATKFFLMIPGAGLFAAMGVSSLTNVIFTYRFILALCSVFAERGKNGLEYETLVHNVISLFKGNGIINDGKDIISILLSSYATGDSIQLALPENVKSEGDDVKRAEARISINQSEEIEGKLIFSEGRFYVRVRSQLTVDEVDNLEEQYRDNLKDGAEIMWQLAFSDVIAISLWGSIVKIEFDDDTYGYATCNLRFSSPAIAAEWENLLKSNFSRPALPESTV